MSGPVVLRTERLDLCAWDAGDGDAFARHLNTPAVMRWLGGVLSPDKLAAAIDRYTRWQVERGFTFWVVRRRADGNRDEGWLGFCGLKLADTPGNPIAGEMEIGWRLREDAWGQGYAGEAAAASLRHAFGPLAAPRVFAVTVPGNRPSWTLMRRLGMRRLPELDYADNRFGPELTAAIIHGVTADEWRAQHPIAGR